MSWIFTGLFGALFSALAGFITSYLRTQEDVTLGQAQQRTVDQQAVVAQAETVIAVQNAEQKAVASAPQTKDQLVASLNDGSF